MITIHPYGGLCNRMRCIDSGIHLARDLGQRLRVIWEPNDDLNAEFYDLFKTVDHFSICNAPPLYAAYLVLGKKRCYKPIKEILKRRKKLIILDGNIKKLFYEKNMRGKLSRYRHIYIYSFQRFMYPEEYDAFKPIDRIQRIVDAFTRRFNEHTIGLHIRRQDHEKAICESPLALFIERMENELLKRPGSTFFLATDDVFVKHDLVQRFGSTVIKQEAELSRQTQSGAASAVVDLFALAKTNTIWGSSGSSFCETAHHIGNNDLIILRRGKNNDRISKSCTQTPVK